MSSPISAHAPQTSLKQQRLIDQAAQKGLLTADDLNEVAAPPADRFTKHFTSSCGSGYTCGSSYGCGSSYVPSFSCGSTYTCGSSYGCGSSYVPSYSCGSTYSCGSSYNDGVGQTVAGQGLRAMFSPTVAGGKEQARIGGQYLNEVTARSNDSNERIVASTANRVVAQAGRWRGQVAAAEAALSAIAAGNVGGPIGSVLSKVGMWTMFSSNMTTIHDQALAGLTFTSAVQQYTQDPSQRAGAEAALHSANSVTTARSQVAIMETFLASQR